MLTANNDTSWNTRFCDNYHLIGHPATRSSQKLSLGTSAVPQLSKLSSTKYPYQIVFSLAHNIPIPSALDTADEHLACYIRVSLFDCDLQCFFGRTWQSSPIWSRKQSHQKPASRSRDEDSGSEDEERVAEIAGGRLNVKLKNQVPDTKAVRLLSFKYQII